MKSVSFILWQRLAAEAAKKHLNAVVEATKGELQTKEEALAVSQAQCAAREEEFKTEVAAREEEFKTEVAAREEEFKTEVATLREASAKSRGVKGVGEVMATLRTRRAAGAFSRWSCVAVQQCEEKRVSALKDAERAQAVEALRQEAEKEKAQHEQSVQALKARQQERERRAVA